MKKEEDPLERFPQAEREHDRPVADGEIERLRSAQKQVHELAARIPPLSAERVHALTQGNRLSQFQLRRQADRYLLAVCLSFLAVAASLLRHTVPAGLVPFNVAILVLAVAVAWVALRAAVSLWLMRQTLRLRHRPYRMSRYADRLSRLSRRRHLWLGFVLKDSYSNAPDHSHSRPMQFPVRLPSYSIAACLFLFIVLNSDKAFAATHNYVKVSTTTERTSLDICNTVANLIELP